MLPSNILICVKLTQKFEWIVWDMRFMLNSTQFFQLCVNVLSLLSYFIFNGTIDTKLSYRRDLPSSRYSVAGTHSELGGAQA